MADAPALELAGVSAGYGDTVVLEDVNLKLGEGATLSVIGRNGVGKSTLLATIMGHTTLHAGTIKLHGKDIGSLATYTRVHNGLGLVPQEREIFPSLTVRENLEVAARPGGRWNLQTVFELFPRLSERESNRGNQLSGGEQQMLAIGRALIGNPSVILMDEPSEGLAPVIVEELARSLKRLTETDVALILVEQNTRLALDLSPRTVVMDRGRIVYDGDSETLRNDAAKLDALIGVARA